MQKAITSLQNARIKQIVKLRQRRNRDLAQETIVEGVREIECAINNGFLPKEIFFCPEIVDLLWLESLLSRVGVEQQSPIVYEVNTAVFSKIAYREGSGGVLLVMPYWHASLENLVISKRPFFAVIENVEKPGNLGAILRTTDSAGVDGIIVCTDDPSQTFDLYNPNVVRASLGALFTQPVIVTTTQAFIQWANDANINIIAASPDAKSVYTSLDFTKPIAIVAGSEAFGLSNRLLNAADETAVIPMNGQVDSLNLSVSTAVLLYEVVRQRTQ